MNAITINAKNRSIELSKTFAKAASIFGSEEYNQLQVARRDYPNYRMVTIKQKSAAKADFANLTYNYMDKYVKDHAQTDDVKTEYRIMKKAVIQFDVAVTIQKGNISGNTLCAMLMAKIILFRRIKPVGMRFTEKYYL